MKLPLYKNNRTNKRVSRYLAKDKSVSTHYEECSKCDGKGEYFFNSSSKSILSHIAPCGTEVFREQLCTDCDERTVKYCRTCFGRGCIDFIKCDKCVGSGRNYKTKSNLMKLYKSDNRRQVVRNNPMYNGCFDCNTRICQQKIWAKEKMHIVAKKVDYSDLYD